MVTPRICGLTMGVGAVTVSHVTGSPRGSYVLDKQEPPTRFQNAQYPEVDLFRVDFASEGSAQVTTGEKFQALFLNC